MLHFVITLSALCDTASWRICRIRTLWQVFKFLFITMFGENASSSAKIGSSLIFSFLYIINSGDEKS